MPRWICISISEVAFDCSCGSSFILNGHLWVIITEPFGSPEQVIIVNLTTKRSHSDTTVILSPGDHSFIKHETVINYNDARIKNSDDIKLRVHERFFEPRESFRDGVILVIQQGLIDSPRTPRDIKKIFIDSGQAERSG